MPDEASEYEIDISLRLTAQDLLLQQLYLQLAHMTKQPEAMLTAMEGGLINVFANIKPPAHGVEDRELRILMAQRSRGPQLMQDFFRKVRANLPKG